MKKHFLGALIEKDDYVLTLRQLGAFASPNGGFHLPGGLAKGPLAEKASLKNLVADKYLSIVEPGVKLGDFTSREGSDSSIVLSVYLCRAATPLTISEKNAERLYVSCDDLDDHYLDSLDKAALRKFFLFRPLYRPLASPEQLGEKDKTELAVYLAALRYYGLRVPFEEAQDFVRLSQSGASIVDLRKAFLFLLSRFSLDYNEYLDLLDYRAKRKSP